MGTVFRNHGEFISGLAVLLSERKRVVSQMEQRMQDAVARAAKEYPGSLRQMARDMGISVVYLSDICHRRRKVSDAVVEKLGRLK